MTHRACIATLAIVFVLLAAPPARSAERAEAPAPAARIPWTTSHVTGSPEPPPPYQLVRVYPKIAINHALDINFAPGSTLRFVAEQGPKIYCFPDSPDVEKPTVFFDASKATTLKQTPGCTGVDTIFGFTLHPKFQQNHELFVDYLLRLDNNADRHRAVRVSRFTCVPGATPNDPPTVDMASEKILLEYRGVDHYGGCLKFGPDGMLYVSAGDGSPPTPPDQNNTGQDISDLNAGIARIDVDHDDGGKAYAIPADNPFVHTPGARGEVWAYGLRNPWRYSFDRATGNLWVGDVGWETWEMVYRIDRGGNYGWSVTEGPGSVHPDSRRGPTPILPPVLYLSHAEAASITGGFVYRGKKFPDLVGQYVFGDWETRRVWAAPLTQDGKSLGKYRTIAVTDQRICAFAEDPDGELWIVDYEGGGVYQLAPQPAETADGKFPRTLSETGLFASVKDHAPAAGVVPFKPNSEQWVDYAMSDRLVALPGSSGVRIDNDKKLVFPKNAVLTRTLSMEMEAGNAASKRRLETQMLHFDGKRWNAYTYRWNDAQTDATLVDAAGDDQPLKVRDPSAPGGVREQTWHFNSRAQCLTCHTSWSGYTLAFNAAQLTRPGSDAHYDDSILPLLARVPPSPKPLADPHDLSADLNLRARSYLATNCSVCHRFGGGGSANIDLSYDLPPEKTRAFDLPPTQGTFGLTDARVIAPGAPARSVLYYRMAKSGSGHMPHMGSTEIDPFGVALVAKWVESLSTPTADVTDDPSPARLATTSGALAVVRQIDGGTLSATARQSLVSAGYASDKPEVRDLFTRFVPYDQRVKTLGASFKAADVLALTGDAARGHDVFAVANGGLCAKCHRVGSEGADFGPDLSHVGGKYDRVQLLENVVEPSKQIADGYAATFVKVKHGDPQVGLLVKRTDTELTLRTGPGVDVKIAAGDIDRVTTQSQSLMPEGLLGGLTAQQAADLLEYLQSLK